MEKTNDVPSRHEIGEKLDRMKEDLHAKEADLDMIATDMETVRRTLVILGLKGTAEGSEETKDAIKETEDTTERIFDHEDEDLDRVQQESEEYEGDLKEGADASERDLDKISDAERQIETPETANEFEKAKDAMLREIEFLIEQYNRGLQAREGSKEVQDQLRSRVRTGKA